ncbi:hypothetical protein E9993_01485 [Labilibacter sediminis]|nr:hypothetical protein E9993_01485 [Labilibacter sediminis]
MISVVYKREIEGYCIRFKGQFTITDLANRLKEIELVNQYNVLVDFSRAKLNISDSEIFMAIDMMRYVFGGKKKSVGLIAQKPFETAIAILLHKALLSEEVICHYSYSRYYLVEWLLNRKKVS